MSENDKEKVKIEDLPVPLKDLNPDEQEEVKGGIGIGVVNPVGPNLNPRIPRPSEDQY